MLALVLGPGFPRTFDGFLELLEKPPKDWYLGQIPEGLDSRISLLYEGQLTELAEEYLESEGIRNLGIEAIVTEQENKFMQELLRAAREKYQGTSDDEQAEQVEGDYAAVRRFIIENCFTLPSAIRTGVPRAYKELVQAMYHAAREYDELLSYQNYYWDCSACGALNVDSSGHQKTIKPGACSGRCPGSTGWRRQERDPDLLVLKRGVQQRTLIHGKEEIRLFDWSAAQLKSPSLSKVTLYPGVDRYDIRLEFSDSQVWAVDVKDYREPLAVGKQINQSPPSMSGLDRRLRWDRFFYVIPDYHQQDDPSYCSKARREAGLDDPSFIGVLLTTISEFKDQLKQKLWELE
jgi:hypothetical protein